MTVVRHVDELMGSRLKTAALSAARWPGGPIALPFKKAHTEQIAHSTCLTVSHGPKSISASQGIQACMHSCMQVGAPGLLLALVTNRPRPIIIHMHTGARAPRRPRLSHPTVCRVHQGSLLFLGCCVRPPGVLLVLLTDARQRLPPRCWLPAQQLPRIGDVA